MIQPLNHIVVVFRKDDISALSDVDHERDVAAIFERYGIPQTLGIIPLRTAGSEHDTKGNSLISLRENPKIAGFIRGYVDRSGSEIALHGYKHQTNQFSRPWRKEYFEFRGLSLEEQEKRIFRGTEIISQTLNVVPQTFIPSWNWLDLNTLLACKKNNYKIVSAGIFTPILDGLISFGANCDVDNFQSILRQVEGSKNRVFLCVNYHSGKIIRQREFESLKKAVSLAAETPECEVVTISEAVSRCPNEIRLLNEAGKNIASQETVFDTLRGRAAIYKKFFSFLPQARRLNSSYQKAKESYYQGMYDEVRKLSSSIDEKSKHLIWMSRGIASLIGLFFSILSFLFISWMIPVNQTLSWVMTFLILAMCWAGIWWYATFIETKKEIRLAGLLSLMSGGVGMIVFYVLRHFLN
jgi:hypothetical protein